MPRFLRSFVFVLALGSVACHGWDIRHFSTPESLYQAAMERYSRHKWQDAIAGFEKLTTELSPRDTLLSRSYWYLAQAHSRQGEHLLAAQSFSRLVESFPDDSLADDAALASAREYRKLWRKPQLDATYGETALAAYNQMIGLFPSSDLIPQAQREVVELNNWFARKNYDAGVYYQRRKAFDSAEIYFREVLARWPDVPIARNAGMRLVEVFRALRYHADASEMCTRLRTTYPSDTEVRQTCTGIPDTAPPDTGAVRRP